jgi:sorbitol/mannitol transport system permease protein
VATAHSRTTAKLMMTPSVLLLFAWMIVPLVMTIYFSLLRYTIFDPVRSWAGTDTYYYFLTDPSFWPAIVNTLLLVGGVLLITVVGGVLIALLLDQPFWGQGVVRVLVIAPFFVMPTVAALVWKNMFMNPVNGLFASIAKSLGFAPIDFFSEIPLLSIVIIVAWQWLPFATLIFLTALQSLNSEQLEAAEMDGAPPFSRFMAIIVPHLSRPITIVILIQTIFLLSIFAEIRTTTGGGPGVASTNLTFLVFQQSILQGDVGLGSAGGIIAVVLANIVAIILMRMIGKNLDI